MEQSLADIKDGEKLIDNKVGVGIQWLANYGPPKNASSEWFGH